MFCNHFYIHDATKSNCKIDSPRSKADVILVDADDVTDEVLFRRSRSADVGVVDVAAAPLRPTPTPPPPPRYGGDGDGDGRCCGLCAEATPTPGPSGVGCGAGCGVVCCCTRSGGGGRITCGAVGSAIDKTWKIVHQRVVAV